jgi:aldehyde:ferredoxin oxidoreductase
MPLLGEGGDHSWNSWQDSCHPGAGNLFAVNWREKFVRKDARCAPPCTMMCSKISLVTEGPHAGVLTEGPEYETEYALGACYGITDQAPVIEADARCWSLDA